MPIDFARVPRKIKNFARYARTFFFVLLFSNISKMSVWIWSKLGQGRVKVISWSGKVGSRSYKGHMKVRLWLGQGQCQGQKLVKVGSRSGQGKVKVGSMAWPRCGSWSGSKSG